VIDQDTQDIMGENIAFAQGSVTLTLYNISVGNHTYGVKAIHPTFGVSDYVDASVMVVAYPVAVTNVTAVEVSPSTVKVSWADSNSANAEYTVTSNPSGFTSTVASPATETQLSGLSVGTYTFSVSKKQNSITINSGDSNQVTTTSPPTPPSNLGCFLAGTPVLTPYGYVPIETIEKGSLVTTSDGRNVEVTRLYKKHVESATSTTAPYLIPAGSLGINLPSSDIVMSPGHCVQVDAGQDLWLEARNCAKRSNAVQQIYMGKNITYYNLWLPNYFTDNLVVFGGVVVESMNPRTLIWDKKASASRRIPKI